MQPAATEVQYGAAAPRCKSEVFFRYVYELRKHWIYDHFLINCCKYMGTQRQCRSKYVAFSCVQKHRDPAFVTLTMPFLLTNKCPRVNQAKFNSKYLLLKKPQICESAESGLSRSGPHEAKVARWQNLIPSFPWIAPGWRAWGAQSKERKG